MDFQLIDTNTTEVGPKDEEQQTEEETYEHIQQGKTKPTISILEKKRTQQTCCMPKLPALVDNKTYKYSHNCPKPQPQPEQTIEKPTPTEPLKVQELIPNQSPTCFKFQLSTTHEGEGGT